MKDYSVVLSKAKSLLLETGVMLPVHAEAMQQLNENILSAKQRGESGELSEIECWKEGDVVWVVDGYHRLQLYLKKKMPVMRVVWMKFNTKHEAIEYAVAKESTGREKSSAQLKLMRARMMGLFKEVDQSSVEQEEKEGEADVGHKKPPQHKNKKAKKINTKVSAITKANARRLKRDKEFAANLKKCSPAVVQAVETKVIDPTDKDVKILSQLDTKQQLEVISKVRKLECAKVSEAIKSIQNQNQPKVELEQDEPLSSPQIDNPKSQTKLNEARKRAQKAYEEVVQAINGLNSAAPSKAANEKAIGLMKQLYALLKGWGNE